MEKSIVSDFPESYLGAQRAAVEAVEVGRATLAQAECQGEQLRNTHRLADEANYILDRSTRILKGMTWTGWVQNMFSSDPKTPDIQSFEKSSSSYVTMDDVPLFAAKAAQTIRNYQANLTVLQTCETVEQRQTCLIICDKMFELAEMEIRKLPVQDDDASDIKVGKHLSQELTKLRHLQNDVMKRHLRMQQDTTSRVSKSAPHQANRSMSLQDEHLDILASNLGELSMMASSLNEQISLHNNLMDSFEEKADDVHEKTRAVTRRADRLAQKKSWTKPNKAFEKWIAIMHIESGRYLSCNSSPNPTLVDDFHPEKCVYGVWMRKSGVFGLKNKYSNRFLGQTMLGSIACSASAFGQREEWQADDRSWEKSKLLIASAGWGNGGYLSVRPRDGAFQIVSDKAQADLWCLAEVQSKPWPH